MSATQESTIDADSPKPHTHVPQLILGCALLLGAIILNLIVPRTAVDPITVSIWIVLPVLAIACAAALSFYVTVQVGRSYHAFTLTEVPMVVGLFLVSPWTLLAAYMTGVLISLGLGQRASKLKEFFNVALTALEVGVATLTFRWVLGDGTALTPRGWIAAFVGMLVANLVTAASLFIAMTLENTRLNRHERTGFLFFGLSSLLPNTSLALVALIVIRTNPSASVLIFAVAGFFLISYRGYSSLRERYTRLELLYGFTDRTGRSVEMERLVTVLLSEAKDLLRAEIAEVALVTDDRQEVTRMVVGSDGTLRTYSNERLGPVGLHQGVLASGRPVLVSRNTKDEVLRAQLAALDLSDAMVVPLRSEAGIIGTMTMADRIGDRSTFDNEDLRLFETLVNHASVAFENGRLIEQLRAEASMREQQALHDALTGLPNRTFFHQRVEDMISSNLHGGAVLLMDLDRFKEVNDTLGHHNGDLLLQEISRRLSSSLTPSDTLARLGGDEFAILLDDITGQISAAASAERILSALQEPFVISDLTLEVSASIGIALFPAHGDEAATLLQRADVAMYAAKEGHHGYQLYSSEADHYSPRRLALVGELRAAVEHEDLTVYYQPKVALTDGSVVGVEALVRWEHPQFGFIPPDEFVPIAEHTGAIRPLTLLVLRHALGQCSSWRARGADFGVAVNLSVRNLYDIDLPDDIEAILTTTGVPASALTLEITEGTMMADPSRTISVLTRLSDMGIEISIDDFGTGYSSLSYLKRLPVDEVKIDRSFVMNMAADENDAVIVRSTVDLGHNLGLRVVAEGVEDETALHRLAALGCDIAQGYHLARPLPAPALEGFLRGRGALPDGVAAFPRPTHA